MLRTIAVLTLTLALGISQARSEELIHWHTNLATARQVSQQYKVPMLIHFYGDQCMPCESLEKNVFTRPEIASTMQRYFVPVKINATTDRKTAAEFGVHSWPTDVFLGPDGKALSQGVCSQNPNAYLQNLQNIALMNRDRNAMLAGTSKPSNPETGAASPYGRTATNNLQQAAPGRDSTPTPYSNPSTGASPYPGSTGALASASLQSSLPSPTWQGQSANGQAQSGLVNAGPPAAGSSMTLPPPQSAYAQDSKQANVPPTVQWQTNPPIPSSPFSQNSPLSHNNPKLPLAPTLPAGAIPGSSVAMPQAPSLQSTMPQSTTAQSTTAQSIDNRFYNPAGSVAAAPTGSTTPASNAAQAWNSSKQTATATPGQLVSSNNNIVKSDSSDAGSAQSNVPALDGYCPVALMQSQTWTRGLEKHAIRHRGKVYLLSSEAAAKEFMAAPDSFTPVLSGHDPLTFLREGRLVEGSIYDGVLRQDNLVFIFSSDANKVYFRDNYDRLITELETAVSQAAK